MSGKPANDGRRWVGRAALALVPLLVIGATVVRALQERAEERRQMEQADGPSSPFRTRGR